MEPKLISKTQLMGSLKLGQVHESFVHETEGTFDVTLTRLKCAEHKIEPVVVSLESIIREVMVDRVWDPERLKDLTLQQASDDPGLILLIDEPDGTIAHLMIDGIHRAIKLWQVGIKEQLFYMVPKAFAVQQADGWKQDTSVDWGDAIVDGKIIPRSK